MNPRSSGGPWPAFSVFAVIPMRERVDGHRIASLPLLFLIRARFARAEPEIFSQNSSSHRCRAMPPGLRRVDDVLPRPRQRPVHLRSQAQLRLPPAAG